MSRSSHVLRIQPSAPTKNSKTNLICEIIVSPLQVAGRAAQQVQEQHASPAHLLPVVQHPACQKMTCFLLHHSATLLSFICSQSSNEP